MKFVAVILGPLSELEQAEERLKRMSRPAKRFKDVIEGEESWSSHQGFSGEITVLSIVDSYRLLVKFFQSVQAFPSRAAAQVGLSRSSVAQVHPKSSTKCPEAVDHDVDNACGSTWHKRLVKLVGYCPEQRKCYRQGGPANRASAAALRVQSAI